MVTMMMMTMMMLVMTITIVMMMVMTMTMLMMMMMINNRGSAGWKQRGTINQTPRQESPFQASLCTFHTIIYLYDCNICHIYMQCILCTVVLYFVGKFQILGIRTNCFLIYPFGISIWTKSKRTNFCFRFRNCQKVEVHIGNGSIVGIEYYSTVLHNTVHLSIVY